jgi:hypothetical protein
VYGGGQATATAFNTSTNLGGSIYLQDSGGGVNNGGAVIFGAGQGAFAAIKGGLQGGGDNTVGNVYFATRNAQTDSTLTTRMTILNGGNVGIGTTSPASTLDLSGGTLTSRYIISPSGNYLTIQNGAGGSAISLLGTTTAITGGAVYMTGGNVGIGTTSPSQPLDVNGAARVRGNLYNADGTQGYVQMNVGTGTIPGYLAFYKANDTRVGYIGWQYDTNTLVLSSENGFTGYVVTGNLGVGISPSYKLDVSGDIRSSGRVVTPNRYYIMGYLAGGTTGGNYISLGVQQSSGGMAVTASNKLVAPISGLYHFGFNTIMNISTGRNDVTIRVNGSNIVETLSEDNGSGYHYRSGMITYYLNANDFVQFYCGSGTIYGLNAVDAWHTYFFYHVG